MADIADLYEQGRVRMTELAAGLSDDEAAQPVPCCPRWTVKDVYAHVVGIPADVLAGRVDGLTTDPWTARQVEARADMTLAEIIAEWTALAPAFVEGVRALGDHMDPRLVIDQWTHEQDVRGALGRPGSRDVPVVAFAVDRMVRGFGRGWSERGLPAAQIVATSGEWLLGEGEPVAVLRADDAEIVRLLVGRRSRRQALAAWEGDADAVVDHLVAFSFAADDIVE